MPLLLARPGVETTVIRNFAKHGPCNSQGEKNGIQEHSSYLFYKEMILVDIRFCQPDNRSKESASSKVRLLAQVASNEKSHNYQLQKINRIGLRCVCVSLC
jgi:hypothetical protein